VDIWGVLAVLFAGAFFATLIIALFYWRAVRPQLMNMTPPAAPPSALAPQQDEAIQEALQALNESLVRHSSLIARLPTSFEVRAPVDREALAHKLDALQTALTEQSRVLARLEREIDALGSDVGMRDELAAVQEELGSQQVALRILHDLVSALNEGTLNLSATLTAQKDALITLQERQEQNAEMLQVLQDQIGQILIAQQTSARMLDTLASQPVRGAGKARTGGLQDIRGIGPVYARRLKEKGIETFEQLAILTPDELYAVLDVPRWRFDAEKWIAQARMFAEEQKETEQAQ